MNSPKRVAALHDLSVLHNRRVRAGTQRLSMFQDDVWDLTPAVLEAHTKAISINWELAPREFRDALKEYLAFQLHWKPTALEIDRFGQRLSVMSISQHRRHLFQFANFLCKAGVTAFAGASEAITDAYAGSVASSDRSYSDKRHALGALKTLWRVRELLPIASRLPEAPLWGGRSPEDIIGAIPSTGTNSTRRIPDLVISGLLGWSIRLVEDFGDAILMSADRKKQLDAESSYRPKSLTSPGPALHVRRPSSPKLHDQVSTALEAAAYLEREGLRLPMKIGAAGPTIDAAHLTRLLGWDGPGGKAFQQALLDTNVPRAFVQDLFPSTSFPAATESKPGLTIAYNEVPDAVDALIGACLVIVTYLSGMRPSEVLNLERGSVSREGELHVIYSRTFKAVVDDFGEKIPEGVERDRPWVVVEPVARAVQLLEHLSDDRLLFPARWAHKPSHHARAITSDFAAILIERFVRWVNRYCAANELGEGIPEDGGRINLSRFRRTLAWHIVREPRGLVAANIQYGQVLMRITQGYAGDLASGFPDDYAFERFLARIDYLAELNERRQSGERISGAGATRYDARVSGSGEFFAGRLVRTGKEARVVLGNPRIQIYEGKGMHCAFDEARALCLLQQPVQAVEVTPDVHGCHIGCGNRLQTDGDIVEIDAEISMLQESIDDPLAPTIRHKRELARLEHLRSIKAKHESEAF